jgi:hypothetical protein
MIENRSSRLAVIHRFGDPHDLSEPVEGHVVVGFDQCHALPKLQKIILFASTQRISQKEWNNHTPEIASLPHAVPLQILFVIVVPSIDVNLSDSEVVSHHVQAVDTFCSLNHGKLMGDLVARRVPLPFRAIRLSNKIDREASFAIDEPRDPTNS